MRLLFLALPLLLLLASGCIAPEPVPAPAPVPPGLAPTDPPQAPAPALNATLDDARRHTLDPPNLRLRVTLDAPHALPIQIQVQWHTPGRQGSTTEHEIPANQTRIDILHRPALPYGTHRTTAAITTVDPPRKGPVLHLDHTVWAPVRLVLNASEEHAHDQNPFHTDHRIPFAPWQDEDALDILRRAATTYGFTVKTQYRQDLDSYFVEAINGTTFRWEFPEAAGISRNWMVLLEGEAGADAVDDTYPKPNETLEFRYVRCYATGNCDDL